MRTGDGRAAVAGLAIVLVSFSVRVLSYPEAFRQGHPQFVPFDDLYHAKRIVFSASHFPKVLDFDPERGLKGSFCPWPPLYDLAMGAGSRLLGASGPKGILRTAIWFPPIFFSLFAGLAAAVLAARSGLTAGVVSGLLLALSPDLVGASRLGAIDHHFLEPALLLGIAGAVILAVRAPDGDLAAGRGLLLALALVVALLVQTAMLAAAGLALAAILAAAGRSATPLRCGSFGFAGAAAAVFLYRIGRPPGYPDDSWHLGLAHAAALVAAAVALAFAAWWRQEARSPGGLLGGSLLGVGIGSLAAAAVPGAISGFREGILFFGGDPWLRGIQEFHPLFVTRGSNPLVDFCRLGGGALFVIPFAIGSFRRGSRARIVLSVIAAGELLAAVTSARFLIPASAVLAIPAALLVSDLAARRRFGRAAVAAGIILAPTAVGFLAASREIRSVLPPESGPMLVTADFLRACRPPSGRVLGPWWAGHAIDVLGNRPVVIDNFGAAVGRPLFEDALGLLFSPREATVARYCRDHGVRFLVVENPAVNALGTARMLEVPTSLYLTPVPGGREPKPLYRPTRLLKASFWWRAYLGTDPAIGAPGQAPPFASFRLLFPDPARFGYRLPLASSALQVWEFVPAGP